MSRTIDEIMDLLGNNYTPEELVDVLSLSSNDICEMFEDSIIDKIDYINGMISEDLGEDLDDEDY